MSSELHSEGKQAKVSLFWLLVVHRVEGIEHRFQYKKVCLLFARRACRSGLHFRFLLVTSGSPSYHELVTCS
jgi:hypothetical protein